MPEVKRYNKIRFTLLTSLIVFYFFQMINCNANPVHRNGYVNNAYKVKFSDLNCDNKLDFIVSGHKGESILTFINNSNLSFEKKITGFNEYFKSKRVSPIFNFDIADINNDCFNDIVIGLGGWGYDQRLPDNNILNNDNTLTSSEYLNYWKGEIIIGINDKNGKFRINQNKSFLDTDSQPKDVKFIDFNCDGILEIVGIERGVPNTHKKIQNKLFPQLIYDEHLELFESYAGNRNKNLEIKLKNNIYSGLLHIKSIDNSPKGINILEIIPADAYYILPLDVKNRCTKKFAVAHFRQGVVSIINFSEKSDAPKIEVLRSPMKESEFNDVRTIDYNNDNKDDLVIADIKNNLLQFWKRTNYSVFDRLVFWKKNKSYTYDFSVEVGEKPTFMAIENNKKVFVTHWKSDFISIYDTQKNILKKINVNLGPYGIDINNINNDEYLDIVLANHLSDKLNLILSVNTENMRIMDIKSSTKLVNGKWEAQ